MAKFPPPLTDPIRDTADLQSATERGCAVDIDIHISQWFLKLNG